MFPSSGLHVYIIFCFKSYIYAISMHIHPFSIPLVLWGPIPASQAEGRKTPCMDHQSICNRNFICYSHSRSVSSLLACWFDPSSMTCDTAWRQSLPVSIAPSSTRKVWDGQNPDTTTSHRETPAAAVRESGNAAQITHLYKQTRDPSFTLTARSHPPRFQKISFIKFHIYIERISEWEGD